MKICYNLIFSNGFSYNDEKLAFLVGNIINACFAIFTIFAWNSKNQKRQNFVKMKNFGKIWKIRLKLQFSIIFEKFFKISGVRADRLFPWFLKPSSYSIRIRSLHPHAHPHPHPHPQLIKFLYILKNRNSFYFSTQNNVECVEILLYIHMYWNYLERKHAKHS